MGSGDFDMQRPDRKEMMKYWDRIREHLLEGVKGSLPRDIFESILDHYDEYIEYLENEITGEILERRSIK